MTSIQHEATRNDMGSAILDQLATYGPEHCETLSEAQATAYTARLVRSQYENFTVVSWLLPKRLRGPFANVYAFCRWADDLGDETGDHAQSLRLLDWWRGELTRCYDGKPRHPVFIALRPTIQQFDIPRKPFDDLIDAFVQDQSVDRYETWDQAVDYCTRSADPVGRLVLYLCGYRDEKRQLLSDRTCTALQLANFWQDVRRDIIERDRIYLPKETLDRHGLTHQRLVAAVKENQDLNNEELAGYKATVRELVDRTWALFQEGRALFPLIARDIRIDIELFSMGGESILRLIEGIDYDTLHSRPSLSKPAKIRLMGKALWGKLTAAILGGGGGS